MTFIPTTILYKTVYAIIIIIIGNHGNCLSVNRYMYFTDFYLCVGKSSGHACEGVHWNQKKALDLLELEIGALVSSLVGSRN